MCEHWEERTDCKGRGRGGSVAVVTVTVESVTSVVAAVALTMFVADFASAQEAAGGRSLINLTSAFSVAVVVMGAAYGISKLAAAAYESMARQPEVAGNIQTAMIIAAALNEGFTFYALFICSGKTN